MLPTLCVVTLLVAPYPGTPAAPGSSVPRPCAPPTYRRQGAERRVCPAGRDVCFQYPPSAACVAVLQRELRQETSKGAFSRRRRRQGVP
jgi:hypothetical protein